MNEVLYTSAALRALIERAESAPYESELLEEFGADAEEVFLDYLISSEDEDGGPYTLGDAIDHAGAEVDVSELAVHFDLRRDTVTLGRRILVSYMPGSVEIDGSVTVEDYYDGSSFLPDTVHLWLLGTLKQALALIESRGGVLEAEAFADLYEKLKTVSFEEYLAGKQIATAPPLAGLDAPSATDAYSALLERNPGLADLLGDGS